MSMMSNGDLLSHLS